MELWKPDESITLQRELVRRLGSMEPGHATEIVGRIKSTAIETRLAAIQEAQRLFHGFFNAEDTLAEWARKAIVIETFYNVIREELRQAHVRIGHKIDSEPVAKPAKSAASSTTRKKTQPAKGFDLASMMLEFKEKILEGNK